MNNINGINSYVGPRAVGPAAAAKAGNTQPTKAAEASAGQDRVEISRMAHYLSLVADMPEIRTDKVLQVRQALENGAYDTDSRLSAAVDRFLDETFQE